MAEMDPETQAHIEAQRRPPASHEPRKLSGSEPDLAHERRRPLPELEEELSRERQAAGIAAGAAAQQGEVAPASSYIADRRERERKQILIKLDRIAPATLTDVDGEPVLTIRVPCSGCGQRVDLTASGGDFEEVPLTATDLDPESAGVMRARMLAAGWLRTAPVEKGGRFSGVTCDECLRKVEAAEAQSKIAADRDSRLSDACLPKALQGFAFEQMEPSGHHENDRMTAISAARTWAAKQKVEEKPGLLIFGHKGAGKTRLAATTAWQRLRSYPVRWVSWPALVGQLLGAFDDEDRKVATSVLNGTQALILDDIARDDITVSDWVKTQLFVAIDKRVQAGAPLLLTTNLTGTLAEPENPIAALGERLGGSIASRLVGYCRVVELPGNDNRLRFNYDGSKPMTTAEQEAAREGMQDPEEDNGPDD